MEIHCTKHHATYVKNVNEAIAKGKFDATSDKDFFATASVNWDAATQRMG